MLYGDTFATHKLGLFRPIVIYEYITIHLFMYVNTLFCVCTVFCRIEPQNF